MEHTYGGMSSGQAAMTLAFALIFFFGYLSNIVKLFTTRSSSTKIVFRIFGILIPVFGFIMGFM